MPRTSNESRAKNWTFTLNNYQASDIERLEGLGGSVDYLVFGKEVSESGTPHLQGFVQLSSRLRLRQVKELIGSNPHCETARNVLAAAQYCKKDGDFSEIGSLGGGSGSRTDLEEFKATVKQGTLDFKTLREKYSEIWAKYPRFCVDYVGDQAPDREIPTYPLRPWQETLNRELNGPPDDRTIHFIVDITGNNGKTWFAHYYRSLHPRTQVLSPGKCADMAYALESNIRVLFLDAPRSKQGEFIQYNFLEQVKDGYVFCSKYESRLKQLPKCHVVVMTNSYPDVDDKLSADRVKLTVLD